mmetsp:Transcript_48371/g.101061  ORF Transcript_48371/g.101061 Transcript_48371/m.101061 type:complete len:439 (-) Transcript_48371:159-1475(-)
MIFLLRKEYQRLWSEIKARYYDGDLRVVVTGTTGIGKSAFRFFVLRQWLLGDVPGFQSVVFNAGEKYYRVDEHGKVIVYEPQEELDRQSLCLLDPCAMLDRQRRLLFGLTLVTSSPSPLTKQQNKFSLSDFDCYTLVMKAWTVSELRAVYPQADQRRVLDFSYQKDDGERLCIPRWIIMDEDLVEIEIVNARDGTSAAALRRFLRTPNSYARDPNMPYALCRIEFIPRTGWAATGFISNYVAKYIHKWVSDEAALNIENFNELIQCPFSYGLFGSIFEDWVKTGLGEKGKVLEVKLENRIQRYQFNGVQSYGWRRIKRTGKVIFASIHLEDGVFNKPDGVDSPSIDGYAVHSNTLVMVQPTVSLTHTGAKLVAVEDLINAAKSKGVTSVLMVYVVLNKNIQQFKVPDCKELVEAGATICVGFITDESDLIAKFMSELC